jgi:type IV pilus assembly protein PilO
MGGQLRGLLIALVIAMPVVSYFMVFRPQNLAINKVKAEADHRELMLEKLKEETQRNADLEKANQEVKDSIKIIEARLPSSKEVDGLVRQVSMLALERKLNAPAMKSSRPVQTALYMEQPIEIEVSGSFVGFFTFLSDIEKLPRITRVHDLKITGQDKQGEELKAIFTLSIYFQDEKQLAQGESK